MTPTWWPYALAAVLLLALLIVILLVLLLRKASKASQFSDNLEPEPPPPDAKAPPEGKAKPAKGDRLETAGISSAFRRVAHRLKEGRQQQGEVPLFLLVGAELSRDPDLLATSGVDLPFGTPEEAEMSLGDGRGFWFFDRGIILDVAGELVLRADGITSDERGWSAILDHLRRLRPKRPLDGAIVTVAVADLIDANANERSRAELSARMNRVYRKLIEIQQQLGFRVPCYITITGCERLTGFNSLCASLRPASREQMLGWSSPYSIDSAYRSSWSDEAVAACAARLDEVQLEAFTDGTPDASSLLGFPNLVRRLAVPLRVCLDQLFRSSAYHGALIMRGLYFCGREEEDPRAVTALTPSAGRTAFLHELIEQKVFAEYAVARPTAGLITQRRRAVRIAQVAVVALAVLFGGGLVHAYRRLAHQNERVTPFLSQSQSLQAVTRQVHGNAAPTETKSRRTHRTLYDSCRAE